MNSRLPLSRFRNTLSTSRTKDMEDRKLNKIFIHNGSMNFRFLRLDPGITQPSTKIFPSPYATRENDQTNHTDKKK